MLIRILTEDKNRETVVDLCNRVYDGYTLIQGQGTWKGVHEPTLVIEVAVEDTPTERATATMLARRIKVANEQEAVLIEFLASTNVFI